MRSFKILSALFAVLAFSAIAVASASAAETLWQWLPGAEKTAFTGKSAKAVLQVKGGASITCPESTTTSGEITTEKTLGLAIINFGKTCTTGGLAVESLGDVSGTILAHVEIHNCTISAGKPGLLIKVLPLHLEVPSTKLLLAIEGEIIAEITPNKTSTKEYTLVVEQKEGKQAIEKCEGGEAHTLSTSTDGGAFVQSGQEAKEGKITFTSVAQEAMA
jgi:hypothetical protein